MKTTLEATVSWKDYTDALLAEHRHAKQIIIDRLTAELQSNERLQIERNEAVKRDVERMRIELAGLTSRVDTNQGKSIGAAGIIGWVIGISSVLVSAMYMIFGHKQ